MQTPRHSRSQAPEMFDRISGTYDLLNRILSLGMDVYWRQYVAKFIQQDHCTILDCATGTGDQLLAVLKKGPKHVEAWGIDPSVNMLDLAQKKFANTPFAHQVHFLPGQADTLPFDDQFFDFITMSFGIRNVVCVETALKELRRVLKRGGTLALLEFSLPPSHFIRFGHHLYLKHLVPFLGKCIAKESTAYRYLSDTIAEFPYGDQFCALMRQAGFLECRAHPLTMGITTVYVAS
ncbi:MAG: bifunctional demethylmenaquinone methyltransferase/2-methoxy-6-polyprenyl-1,4-benzoquinol methylase UbiE [Simkania sp.]|nr:bifunctional demethylmenaquinone methyltransferase/2-methoxy-6-polyprenyl-1,4-benzoquinol methylase UbiE [Simkania sp.]